MPLFCLPAGRDTIDASPPASRRHQGPQPPRATQPGHVPAASGPIAPSPPPRPALSLASPLPEWEPPPAGRGGSGGPAPTLLRAPPPHGARRCAAATRATAPHARPAWPSRGPRQPREGRDAARDASAAARPDPVPRPRVGGVPSGARRLRPRAGPAPRGSGVKGGGEVGRPGGNRCLTSATALTLGPQREGARSKNPRRGREREPLAADRGREAPAPGSGRGRPTPRPWARCPRGPLGPWAS